MQEAGDGQTLMVIVGGNIARRIYHADPSSPYFTNWSPDQRTKGKAFDGMSNDFDDSMARAISPKNVESHNQDGDLRGDSSILGDCVFGGRYNTTPKTGGQGKHTELESDP